MDLLVQFFSVLQQAALPSFEPLWKIQENVEYIQNRVIMNDRRIRRMNRNIRDQATAHERKQTSILYFK